MTLSQAPRNSTSNQQIMFFKKLEKYSKTLANAPRILFEKTITALKNKIDSGMPLEEIEKKLEKFPAMLALFQKFKPTEKELQGTVDKSLVAPKLAKIEEGKKNKIAQSLKKLETSGFLKETWEAIQKTVGVVVDGALSILKAIPKKYLIVAGALLLLLGSVTAVLSFLSLGASITAAESFGALTAMIPSLTPEIFTAMVEPLTAAFSAAPVSIAVPF